MSPEPRRTGETWRRLLRELEAHPSQSESARAVWIEIRERLILVVASAARRSRNRDAATAEDVLQELVLRLLDPHWRSRLQQALFPGAYLHAAALNEFRRRAMPRQQGQGLHEAPVEPWIAPLAEPGSGWDLDLARLLRGLPAEDLQLLRLRFWLGLPLDEIALRTGARASTVGVRLHRLLRQLRTRRPSGPGA